MNAEPDDRQRLAAMLARLSYREGSFVLASGRRSSFYIDVKQTVFTAAGAQLIGRLAYRELSTRGVELAGGMAVGAVPLVTAVLCAAAQAGRPLSGFFVRKQPKNHGTGATIDGPFRPDARIGLLEDVVTTGESTIRAIDAVEAAGGQVAVVVAVVDRQEEGGLAAIARRVPEVVALCDRAAILAAAKNT
ncbi:MAG: orotate phosphoribosyltransferase [Candidatus Dadabacteria bacterium]|nr:MAG: orotate phosphoribosyltransferase [Candidatus Dadabacteria bacterium]